MGLVVDEDQAFYLAVHFPPFSGRNACPEFDEFRVEFGRQMFRKSL
jgi:hypothetical protein